MGVRVKEEEGEAGGGGGGGSVFFFLLLAGRTRVRGLQPDGDPACDPTTRRRFSVWHYNRDCAAYREARPFLGRKPMLVKTLGAIEAALTRAADSDRAEINKLHLGRVEAGSKFASVVLCV